MGGVVYTVEEFEPHKIATHLQCEEDAKCPVSNLQGFKGGVPVCESCDFVRCGRLFRT